MSQPNGLLILGDHLFLNFIFFRGQRGLINTAGIINPNLTLFTEAGFRIEKTTPGAATMGLVMKVGSFPGKR